MPQRFPGPEPTQPDNTTPNEIDTGEGSTSAVSACMYLLREENGEYVFSPSPTEISECGLVDTTEHVIMEYQAYQDLYASSSYAFMDPEFFTQAEMQNIFSFSFSLPLIVFLVAWGYQTVIDFATDHINH